MSFFPTRDELRAGLAWLRRHPVMSTGVIVAAVGALVVYVLSESEPDDEKKPQQGRPLSSPPPVNPQDLPIADQFPPQRRSVVWSDDVGGDLETVLGREERPGASSSTSKQAAAAETEAGSRSSPVVDKIMKPVRSSPPGSPERAVRFLEWCRIVNL